MAHISAGVEYALHILLYLVASPQRAAPAASARDLAQLQGLPADFVAKLLTRMEKAGLVVGSEGIGGGFALARAADAISVLDVVTAIDGEKPLFDCREIRGRCAVFADAAPTWASKGVCAIHVVMLDAERGMRAVLGEQTLGAISARVAAKAPPRFGASVTAWLDERAATRRKSRNTPQGKR